MPIRINLLAEGQALEELRRRDPVKRALWIAGFLITAVVVWCSMLQLRVIMARSEVNTIDSQISMRKADFSRVQGNQSRLEDIKLRLDALNRLAQNRFLNASLLNALQRCIVDDVQLVRLHTEHFYSATDEVKARTNSEGRYFPAKPATATEKIGIVLDGRDAAMNPGDKVNHFRSLVASNAYFRNLMGPANEVVLKSLSAPQISPETGKPFVLFTLECRLPEKTR